MTALARIRERRRLLAEPSDWPCSPEEQCLGDVLRAANKSLPNGDARGALMQFGADAMVALRTRAAGDDAIDRARERSAAMVSALAEHSRAVIVAGPRTGKGSISVRASERYGRAIRYGDALVGKLDWSPASEEVARWLDEPGDWIVEGVVTVRAIRKWLSSHDEAPPFAVMWLAVPVQVQSSGQQAMSKGVRTVWDEIAPELQRRGAVIIERD